MKVVYATKKLERLCRDAAYCRRVRSDVAVKVGLRHNALEVAASVRDLCQLDPLGRWHALHGNREGQWAGWLSQNQRMIILPIDGGVEVIDACDERVVEVLELVDYH